MRSPYVCITLLLAGLSPLASLPAQARGETGEEDALATVERRHAPLTLSANGQWLLHVDSQNVLHRVSLADEKQAQRIVVPLTGLRLAASRSGQRVAVTTSSACVGLVDFGDTVATVPKLMWLPSGPSKPWAGSPQVSTPGMPSEEDCGREGLGNSPIAISTDGRWIATPSQVYDVDAKKVIASLPVSTNDIGGRRTLRLQFLDNDTKLLVITATLGEGYESSSTPSNLQFAVWDLSSKALYNLISLNNARLDLPQSFFTEYTAQTGALYWVNGDRHWAAEQSLKEGDVPPPLEVMQGTLGACNSKPVSRFPLAAGDWVSFLMDPLGRWIAGVRKVDTGAQDGKNKKGLVEELIVVDLGTRRQVVRLPLKEEVHGLVSTHDGGTIYGLTARPIDRSTGMPTTQAPGPHAVGEVVKVRVDLGRVSTPKAPTATWDATPCKIEDETPSARSVHHPRRFTQPLWSVPIESVTDLHQRAQERRGGSGDGQSAANMTCTGQILTSNSFVMQDKTLWLDRFSEIAQLDTSSGRTIKTLPTPRKDNVCSLPVPEAGGFVNYQGDTLTWRPFDPSAAGATARHVIEVRQGWQVSQVRAAARSVVAVWNAKPGTAPPKGEDGQPMDVLIATYDAATRSRQNERRITSDAYEIDGGDDPAYEAYERLFLPACRDTAGRLTSGYDWRVSHFDSFRAYACSPGASATQTVFWSHLDIAPQSAPPSVRDGAYLRRTWVLDGTTGVAQDGAVMRVFNIATRHELAQIAVSFREVQAVHLIESKGLLLIESVDYDVAVDRSSRNLRAYSFK